jgi:hypothetical protein
VNAGLGLYSAICNDRLAESSYFAASNDLLQCVLFVPIEQAPKEIEHSKSIRFEEQREMTTPSTL